MPFLAKSSLKAPILGSLKSGPPPRARALVADPVDDLIIPAADGKVLRPAAAEFDGLLPFNLRTTVRPLVIAQCRTARRVWAWRCSGRGCMGWRCAGMAGDIRTRGFRRARGS